MAEIPTDLDPVSVFSLLGDETRLSILQTLYTETRGGGAGRGTVTYSTLREAVGEPDSGKFNYHLSKLTGHFVEKLRGGYALRAPGKEVIRVLRGGTLTRAPEFDPVETDASCPRCEGSVLLSYANEHVFVHCVDCVGLLEFEYVPDGTLLAVSFPPAGAAERGPEALLDPATLGFERRIGSMAADLCPACGGAVTPSLYECPDHEYTDSTTCDHCNTTFGELVRLVCETCERQRIAPPALACTDRPPVAEALVAAGADGSAWERYVEITRWSTSGRGDPEDREVVYTPTAGPSRIVVGADLSVDQASAPPSEALSARLDE